MTAPRRKLPPPPRAWHQDPGRTWERTYPGTEDQIRHVRAALRPLLTECPMADDVILGTSELAANAALHSYSSLPGGTFTVRAIVRPGEHVLVEVEDGGGPWAPGPTDPVRSHGLDIIGTIAAEWNVRGDHRRRTIWARLDWPVPARRDADGGQHGRWIRAGIESDHPGDIPSTAIPNAGTGPDVAMLPAAQPRG